MIERLIINNFKSIRSLDVPLRQLNALIGYNNSGKSNILDALNIIMGERWPTDPFDHKDFYNYNKNNEINIEVRFNRYLSSYNRCKGFKLTYDGTNRPQYRAIDENGFECSTRYISRFMKNEASLMYLGLNRESKDQLKPTKWTIFGKLLIHIENEMSDALKDTFKLSMNENYDRHLEPILRSKLEGIKNYTKEQTGLDLDFEFKTLDPLHILKNIRPYIKETASRTVDVENVGAGIQSAVSIAIARTYADVVQSPVTVLIEEPELFLHPHACRNFYRLLKNMVGANLQVIYATHERCFVDINEYANIYLVKKEGDETVVKYVHRLSSSPRDELKILSKCDEMLNEVFFANKVIITEGFGDRLACKLTLEKEGVEIDRNNISIIDAGGRNNVNYLAELVHSFDIDCFVLYDQDAQAEIAEAETLLGSSNVKIQVPDLEGMWGIMGHLNRERALRDLPSWIQTHSTPSVYTDLISQL